MSGDVSCDGKPAPGPGGLKYDERGLVAVVAQSVSGDVLMVAWANEEAVRLTLETGRAHYFSRSRQKLWLKGETSGNFQAVSEVLVDCDADTLIYRVTRSGPACHTGEKTCFFRRLSTEG